MNCEQVEELLSAYLDDSLALGETAESASQLRLQVETHLQDCSHCSTVLADYRRFDDLIAHSPRVGPSIALREKIFSSPAYLEITGTYDNKINILEREHTSSHKSSRRNTPGRPQLIALPGGRSISANTTPNPEIHLPAPVPLHTNTSLLPKRRKSTWGLRLMQVAIAATLLLTLGVGSLIAWNMWSQNNSSTQTSNTITPPAGLPPTAPLSAGMHFVFLRAGSLWSSPADGSARPRQLTPQNITVAQNWVVSPPLPGHYSGDLLAYIDLQQARLHTLRSDGQRDTIIPQPLLKAGIAPTSVWDTVTGENILSSLTWSPDDTMLAFVADPTATGLTSLSLYSPNSGTIQTVQFPMKGSVSHPVWSPDGIRIAFELTQGSTVSILDYNTQNHGLLLITNAIQTQSNPNDTILALNWSPDTNIPAITWSVGLIGHVHSIWLRHVGVGGNAYPQELIQGDYAQAVYSSNGDGGIGSWLLIASSAGRATNLWRIDALQGAFPIILTSGKQVNFAQWSPDGTQIDYLDSISLGVGAFHVVNVTTLVDTFIAADITSSPAPAWSRSGQELVYSTGTQTIVIALHGGKNVHSLALRGLAATYTWAANSPSQLVIALGDGQQGIYLVDTQRHTTFQIDPKATDGPILWTEIP